jgi:DNA-binding MarR family transcriptional regulator
MVHLLRSVTVELDLLAASFAGRNQLHPTDLRALIALLDAERAEQLASPTWLGATLGLNSASVTAVVDRLERLGYVERVRDTGDRRRVRLVVTPVAKAVGWAFFGPLIEQLVDAMRAFDAAELATIARFLTTAATVIRTTAPTPGPPAPANGRVS